MNATAPHLSTFGSMLALLIGAAFLFGSWLVFELSERKRQSHKSGGK